MIKINSHSNPIKRDKRRRLLSKKLESIKLQNLVLYRDQSVRELTDRCNLKLWDLRRGNAQQSCGNKTSRYTRIRNRCIMTGRGQSVYRFCKLSRIRLREMASETLLNGVKKASW